MVPVVDETVVSEVELEDSIEVVFGVVVVKVVDDNIDLFRYISKLSNPIYVKKLALFKRWKFKLI